MKFKKRNIIYVFLAIEAISLPASIPAAAQITDKIFFSVPQRAAFVLVEQSPGQSTFIIASNAPFSVISSDMIGDIKVDLSVSGLVNGNAHGAAAQDPGRPDGCVTQTNTGPTRIYQSVRKTAERRGPVIDQAVVVTLSYDESARPEFAVKPNEDPIVQSAYAAKQCNQHPA